MTERRLGLLARAWGGWLVRVCVLGLALYACLFLLQAMALLVELGTAYGSSSLQVEPVKSVPVGGKVVLQGRAEPGSVVQVGTGGRVIELGYANPQGRFEIEFPRSLRDSYLWIRALDPENGRQQGRRMLLLPAPLARSCPLTVDLASPIGGRLWLAGQGPPAERLRIESNGQILGEAWTDVLGIYDVLLDVGAVPQTVRVASRWDVSRPVAVSAAAVPLARTADIRWTGSELQTRLQIVLPARHPHFVALSEGTLPFALFVERIFGYLPVTGTGGPALTVADGKGVVRFADEPIRGSEVRVGVLASAANGINRAPLLTANDRVTVHFGNLAPWIVPPLPVEMRDGRATWRGPVATPPSGAVVALGRDSRAATGLPPERAPREESAELTSLREFVQHFEVSDRPSLPRQAWRTLIVLIPFLVLAFLARRARFGESATWRKLAAVAAVLAVWRIWPLLLAAIDAGQGLWLDRAVAFVFWRSGVRPSEATPWTDRFLDTGDNAFWLLFVALVAMVPLYFDSAVRTGLRWHSGERGERRALGRSVLGGALAGLWGALFATALLASAARWAVEVGLKVDPRLSAAVAGAAWWSILALAGLAALPLVAWLLGALVPFARYRGRARWLAAAALVVLALLMPRLPAPWLLACAGALMVVGLGWVVVHGLPRLGALRRLGAWADHRPVLFLSGLFLLGLILARPFAAKDSGLVELGSFAAELGQVFPYVLAAGVVLVLLEAARGSQEVLLPREILAAGGYLYAVFLLNSASTWMFVPVIFLTGLLLAGVWLFRPQTETEKLEAALPEGRRNPRLLIQSAMESTELGSRLLRIRQALTEKLETMDLKPQEYEERLAEYQDYVKSKANRQELPYGLEPRDLIFAVGEPTVHANTVTALRWGAFLALGPLLVAVYQYLPTRGIPHAFPIMDLLTFLIGATASWLLYAFFFGYFFVHLRGNSGLTKGNHLFSMIAIPFAVYHLLHAPTFEQVRPFLLWVVQLFLFFSLLGLLAFDYGLLRRNGFRFKDLRLVHDMPALSAYASTLIATVVSAVAAALTGEARDVVSFFLENILPRVPS